MHLQAQVSYRGLWNGLVGYSGNAKIEPPSILTILWFDPAALPEYINNDVSFFMGKVQNIF